MPAHKPKPKREPRPGGKSRSSKADEPGSYEHSRAEWESHRSEHRGSAWLIDAPELAADAGAFLATLRRLGFLTQNKRYHEVRDMVLDAGMVLRTGKWTRYGPALANPISRKVCAMIEEDIAAGSSERVALAQAVAAYSIAGPSFSAVVKRLRRLLIAYRKTVGQKPT
jgi:hypothetical protein